MNFPIETSVTRPPSVDVPINGVSADEQATFSMNCVSPSASDTLIKLSATPTLTAPKAVDEDLVTVWLPSGSVFGRIGVTEISAPVIFVPERVDTDDREVWRSSARQLAAALVVATDRSTASPEPSLTSCR